MSPAFDPYHRWLAIPPEEQPPDHYRLLGLRTFEDVPEVIENAADQRMAHLRTFQAGKHSAESQRLLNEVAGAKVCLLNETTRSAYDGNLRRQIQAQAAGQAGGQEEIPSTLGRFFRQLKKEPRRPSRRPQAAKTARRKKPTLLIGLAVAASLLFVGAYLWSRTLREGPSEQTSVGKPPPQTTNRQTPEQAVLVFDLPAGGRHDTKLQIDRQAVVLPESGPLEHRCEPGEHHVAASRRGFEPTEEFLSLQAGQAKNVVLKWVPRSRLVLVWPVEAREDAQLEIDGRPEDLTGAPIALEETEETCLGFALEPGEHNIRLSRAGFEPFEQTVNTRQGAQLRVAPLWKKAGDELPSDGTGLRAELFAGRNFDRRVKTRIDRRVDWFWFLGAPEVGLPADDFSIRWTGWLKAPEPGRYGLAVHSDDGVRLWLDGRLIIDRWEDPSRESVEVEAELSERPHELKIEYYEASDEARVTFFWRRPGGATRHTVHAEALFHKRATAEAASVPLSIFGEQSGGDMAVANGSGSSSPPEEKRRRAPPSQAAQQEIVRQLGEVYDLSKATTPEGKLELARELYQSNRQSSDKPDERYVLLRRAMELSGDAGDATLMLEVADAIAADFEVDAWEFKAEALAGSLKSARTSSQIGSQVEASLQLAEEAIGGQLHEVALGVLDAALGACKRSQGKQFRKQVYDRREEVRRLYKQWQQVQEALSTLEANPDDADANLVAGRWYGFDRGDWEKGLAHLAKGSHEGLRAVAGRELAASPAWSAEWIELADAWWALAQSEKGAAKGPLQLRAAHWYEKALPGTSGLTQKKVEQRLARIGGGTDKGSASLEEISRSGKKLDCRRDPAKTKLLEAYGGNERSEDAVSAGLKWLAEHQGADGGWCFDHTLAPKCRAQCPNPGKDAKARNAASGLALMAFLGAGQTQKSGEYRMTVRNGLNFLLSRMKLSGQGGSLHEPDGRMYSHGIAAIALCEAYTMTDYKLLREPAQQAIKFICYAQDPSGGGWRYSPRQKGDTSVTGWQLTALRTAYLGKLTVPLVTTRKAWLFLDGVQFDEGAAYGYISPSRGDATTPIGLLLRMYLGWKMEDNAALQRGVRWISERGPSKDSYFNYYASQVMRHYGGPMWKKWNPAMRDRMINSQATEGHQAGSWYLHENRWAANGGRLYCTAMAVLILEVYYRHWPIYTE